MVTWRVPLTLNDVVLRLQLHMARGPREPIEPDAMHAVDYTKVLAGTLFNRFQAWLRLRAPDAEQCVPSFRPWRCLTLDRHELKEAPIPVQASSTDQVAEPLSAFRGP